jgi:hypothetical protein
MNVLCYQVSAREHGQCLDIGFAMGSSLGCAFGACRHPGLLLVACRFP